MSKRFIRLMVVTMTVVFFACCQAEGTIVETLTVRADSSGNVMSSVLEAGKLYLIEVEGTYQYDTGGSIADAEWAHEVSWPPEDWVEHIGGDPGALDLLINDTSYDWLGTSDGITFTAHTPSPSHVYRLEWLGTGEALAFKIQDSAYYDNSGSLEVSIVPEPATLLLLGLGGLMLRKHKS